MIDVRYGYLDHPAKNVYKDTMRNFMYLDENFAPESNILFHFLLQSFFLFWFFKFKYIDLPVIPIANVKQDVYYKFKASLDCIVNCMSD